MINALTEIELANISDDKAITIIEQNKEEVINVNSITLNDYFIVIYTKKQTIELISLVINPNKEEMIKSKLIKEFFNQNIVDKITIVINDKLKNTFEIIVFTLTYIFVINVYADNLNYSVKKSAEIQYDGILTCLCKMNDNDNDYSFILGLNNGNILIANIDTTKQNILECNVNKVELIEQQYSLLSYFNPLSYWKKTETKQNEINGINKIFYFENFDIICCLKDDMNIDIISLKNKKLLCTHNYLKERISQSKLHKIICNVRILERQNNNAETNLLIITSFNYNNIGSLICFSFELETSKTNPPTEYLYSYQIKDIMFFNNSQLLIALENGDIIVFDKNFLYEQIYIFTYEHKYMELQSKQTKELSDIISSNFYFREKSILNVMKTKYSKGFSNISNIKNYISFSNSVNYTDIINNLISQEINENKIISFGTLNNNTIALIREQTISILHEMDSDESNTISCSISKMKYYLHKLSILFKNENNLEQTVKTFIRKESLSSDNSFIYIILGLMYIMFDYKENKNVFVTDLEFIHEIINERCANSIDIIINFILEISDNFNILFEENIHSQNDKDKVNQNNTYHEFSIFVKLVSKIIISHIEDLLMFTKSICLLIKWLLEYMIIDIDSNDKKIKIEELLQEIDLYYRYYITAKLISEKQYVPIILLENISDKLLSSYFIDNNDNIDFIIHQLIYFSKNNIPLFKTLYLNKEYILISKCNSIINPKKNILCLNYLELILQIINPKRINVFRDLITFLFLNLPYNLDEDTPKQIQDDIDIIHIINQEILGLNITMKNDNIFSWIYKCINNYIHQTLNDEIKFHFYSFCFYYILPFDIQDEELDQEIISWLLDFVFHLSPNKIRIFIENIKQLYPKYYSFIFNQAKEYLLNENNLEIKYKIIDSIPLSKETPSKNGKFSFLNELKNKIEEQKDYDSNLDNLFLLKQIYLKMKEYLKVIEITIKIVTNYHNTIDTIQQRKNELSDILYIMSKVNVDIKTEMNVKYWYIICEIKMKILNNYENIKKRYGSEMFKYDSIEIMKESLNNDNKVMNMIFEFEMFEFVIKLKFVYYLQIKTQKIFIVNMVKCLAKRKENLNLFTYFIQSILDNYYDNDTNESKFILLDSLLFMKIELYKMKLCKFLIDKNKLRLLDLLKKYEDNDAILILQN